MTVSSRGIVHTYVGNGTQSDWPILFPFFAPEEVKAIRTDVAGGNMALEYGSDYSVVPLESGGTCLCSLGDGERLTLYLELEPTQEVDLRNTGILAPEILERSLDRLTLMVQQQQEQISRCVQVGRTSGLNPSELLESVDASVESCTSSAQAASESAGASAGAANVAGAARDEAVTAAASIALPLQMEGDVGRGLVADGAGGWTFGGTAAGLNIGDAPGDVATNERVSAKLNVPHHAQAIIRALTGMRPDGWGPQDCDAPVCSILADRILPHSTNYGACGIAYSDTYYSAGYEPFILFNGSTTGDFFATSLTPIGTSFGYKHHVPRKTNGITITSFDSAVRANDLTAFRILIDGVLVATVSGLTWTRKETKSFSYPETLGSDIRIIVDAYSGTSGSNSVALQAMTVQYTDVAAGQILIPAGLQVSYADNGRVKVSEVLGAMASVDLGSAADGFHYLYGNLDADGAFASFGFSNIPMEIETERKGAPLMPAFSGYTRAGWGAISATSELVGGSNYAWKAFDSLNGANDCWVADTAAGQSITLNVSALRRITCIGIRSRNDANRGDLKDFRIVVDGVTVATFTGQTWVGNELKVFAVEALVTASLTIAIDAITKSGSASWTAPSIGEIIPYFSEDLFNPATQQTVDVDNQPIRRVPLGSVVKSGGKFVAINCYALGTVAIVPANNGNAVTAASYSVDNPFGDCRATIDSDYWAEDYSPTPTWVHHAAMASWMNLVGGRRRTTLTNKAYSWAYRSIVEYNLAGNGTTPKVRITFKRSY